MKKKKKKDLTSIETKINREVQKSQGFFDGRFRERKILDKKKENDKYQSRKKVEYSSFFYVL